MGMIIQGKTGMAWIENCVCTDILETISVLATW